MNRETYQLIRLAIRVLLGLSVICMLFLPIAQVLIGESADSPKWVYAYMYSDIVSLIVLSPTPLLITIVLFLRFPIQIWMIILAFIFFAFNSMNFSLPSPDMHPEIGMLFHLLPWPLLVELRFVEKKIEM